MLTKNVCLPFVPTYNESLGQNAIIEWKNGAIPAREMMKFRPKTQASPKNRFVYSGNRLIFIPFFASILAVISSKISYTQPKVSREIHNILFRINIF